jgi:hypothetical protein
MRQIDIKFPPLHAIHMQDGLHRHSLWHFLVTIYLVDNAFIILFVFDSLEMILNIRTYRNSLSAEQCPEVPNR